MMVPADLTSWMTDTLVPRWVERAVVPGQAGYVEYLWPDGGADLRPRKTTLVTARLVYAFSHAYLLQPREAFLEAARHGLAFLLSRCRAPGGTFRHALAVDGTAIDPRSDLYDLAFVLFALAWHFRATADRSLIGVADEVADFMDARLAEASGGYAEDDLGTLPRRQNPHMHLLEAFHALAEATGEERWLDRARAMVDLMRRRLLDRATGSLGEFFTRDWEPWPGPPGALREPGHHFEWAWLLQEHARLTGDRAGLEEADRLYGFAVRHGMARMPDGLPVVLDAVDAAGAPVGETRLLWPQTEALKAFAVRAEAGDLDARHRFDRHLALIFRHYLSPSTGLWHNQLDARGESVTAELPVRVLYHIVLALAEAARLQAHGQGRTATPA
jgi:mannose/cellobiose epimerase-like protein (N-acyl-D-glucosamine 2-epimerase family)